MAASLAATEQQRRQQHSDRHRTESPTVLPMPQLHAPALLTADASVEAVLAALSLEPQPQPQKTPPQLLPPHLPTPPLLAQHEADDSCGSWLGAVLPPDSHIDGSGAVSAATATALDDEAAAEADALRYRALVEWVASVSGQVGRSKAELDILTRLLPFGADRAQWRHSVSRAVPSGQPRSAELVAKAVMAAEPPA